MSRTSLQLPHGKSISVNVESLDRFRDVKKDMETRLDPDMVTNDFVLSTLLDVYDLHRDAEVFGDD